MPTTIQSGAEVVTYADVVQYVLDAYGLDRSGLNERHARNATRFAYRDLARCHSWSYYYRQRLLQTVADVSDGTIEFDFTGGSSERLITLTSSTFPSWAAYGRIIIDDVHYEVESNPSSTTLTLTETSNPGSDVASGTTYTLYRNSYPLPVNFRQMVNLWNTSDLHPIFWIDPQSQHDALQVFYSTPDTPVHATNRATGKYLSGQEIVFGPPPTAAVTYDMLFEVWPRPLAIDEHSQGTVAITAGAAAVTGTSTAFPVGCVGSIMRFSDGPTKPSGYIGSIDGADNPFVHQSVIKTRTSATAIVLEDSLPSAVGNLSGVGYTISDPIDIDTMRMLTALQRKALAEFSQLTGRQDMTTRDALARQAVLQAMEADKSMPDRPSNPLFDPIKRASVTNSA